MIKLQPHLARARCPPSNRDHRMPSEQSLKGWEVNLHPSEAGLVGGVEPHTRQHVPNPQPMCRGLAEVHAAEFAREQGHRSLVSQESVQHRDRLVGDRDRLTVRQVRACPHAHGWVEERQGWRVEGFPGEVTSHPVARVAGVPPHSVA